MTDVCACPCGREAIPVGGDRIYPHRPDLYDKKFFLCENCGRYTGTHPNGDPKGVPADAETRGARMDAHAAFDTLWKKESNPLFPSRSEAYQWLAKEFGVEEVHIGFMSAEDARRVPPLVQALRASGSASGPPT